MSKKILNYVLIVIFLSPFAIALTSRNADAVKIKTRNIDRIVKDIQSTYQGLTDLSSDFTQTTKVALTNSTMSSRGRISLKMPGKMRIEYDTPQPKQYISDGKKLWIYTEGDSQVEEYDVSPKSMSKEALQFLRGLGRLDREFNITEIKGGENLILIPRSGDAPYSKLDCTFGTDHILNRVTIYNKSGNVSTYNFSNIRPNSGLADDLFQFKKKGKIKVIKVDT